MKIEVGKRYIRRDGTITDRMVRSNIGDKWVEDPDTGHVYDTEDDILGYLVFQQVELEDDCDLMEELK